MTVNLSSFFLKVQAVEESFFQLSEADRIRAITILSSAIKKLQTLLECTADVLKTNSLIETVNFNEEEVFYSIDSDHNNSDDIFDEVCNSNNPSKSNSSPQKLTRDPKRSIKNYSKSHREKKCRRQTRNSNKLSTVKYVSEKFRENKTGENPSESKKMCTSSKKWKNAEKSTENNTVISNRRLFHCKDCNTTLTHPRSIKIHIESHKKQPMCCLKCRRELENLQEFQFHICNKSKVVKSSKFKSKKHSCTDCGVTFKLMKSLKNHLKNFHKVKSEKKIKCSMCDIKFLKKSTMFHHLKSHADNKMVCMKCGQFCDNFASFSEHMSSHDNNASFKCDKCDQSFMKIQQYKQHISAHEKYNCCQCVQSFSSNEKLKKHERDEHDLKPSVSDDSSHICDVCGKLFLKPGQLVTHQRIHTGEKPLECSLCHVNFRTKRALLKHKETYSHCTKAGISKERHFLCSHCGKSFFRKQTLKRHLRCHTDDRPHMCQYCGYKTSELNNLKRHVLHHFKGQRNFICEICGDAFHTKKTLESHHNHKHNEDRNFSCLECEMTFKSKSGLNRHTKTHSKTKEHICWCDAAFGRLSNLRRHMRSVHGSDSVLPPVRKIAVLDETDPTENMDKTLSDTEKYDQTQLDSSLQEQTMMANCLQMSETYQSHHSMSGHMTLDTQGMVYDNMASAQSLVGYSNTQHVGVDHQRASDYYHSNMTNMSMLDTMAASQDYNNPSCMYIQNVLLPSVAGLLDLSHAGK